MTNRAVTFAAIHKQQFPLPHYSEVGQDVSNAWRHSGDCVGIWWWWWWCV